MEIRAGQVYKHVRKDLTMKVTKIHRNGDFDGITVYKFGEIKSFFRADGEDIGRDWILDKEYTIKRLLKAIDDEV